MVSVNRKEENMKIIAFYLPQFHAIPENDAWWGKGFTEWTNVKKAQPLYKGHIQPEVPLGNNYYNLLNPKTQEWQADLATKYGIDGFCYYHYWFNGKLLLEQPMENMLKNKNINIPFCISWANESWARTWDGKDSNVLIKQNYSGSYDEWKAHFDYLLPFFKDERYIKHDGKPLMILYKPQLFLKCKEMMKYWNQLAIENGFEGIYWGYQHRSAFDSDLNGMPFDFGIEFEPFYTVREMEVEKEKKYKQLGYLGIVWKQLLFILWKLNKKMRGLPIIFDYDKVWHNILSREPQREHICPGAFTSWDNTSRRGRKGTVFKGASPQKFKSYFSQQLERAKNVYHSEFLFINAWNEWAEGAHLEPDEYNGYGYLEAVQSDLKNDI